MSRLRILFPATVAVVVALVALLAVIGCGSSSKTSSTISFWQGYTDIERTAIEQSVADFNATNPGFKVQAVFAGNNDYALTKLRTALAAGKAPDISYQYGSSMALLAKLPQVVDLSAKVKEPGFDWNDFFPAVRLATMANGKVLGVPALVDNLALVYNKKLFDQAGVPYPTAQWTWDDFRAAAKKLTNTSAKQFGWAYINDGSEDTVWRCSGRPAVTCSLPTTPRPPSTRRPGSRP
jgi:multiple sugar transport system substrate-binding protein